LRVKLPGISSTERFMSFASFFLKPFASRKSKPEAEAVWDRLTRAQVVRRHTMTVLGIVAVLLLPWVATVWPESGWVHQGLEWLGLLLILLAILGRCACMLYLGGRKGSSLVMEGPYSVSRNPLYVFSILAVLGIGLQSGSLVVGLVLASIIFTVFRWLVSEEERFLRQGLGQPYADYCQRVPRFWPRLSAWHSPRHATVDLQGIWRTLRDALPYLLAIPLFEAIEFAQASGWVQVRFWVY
jgi:protein-S-isoprenylcysteine O-methyltransferase Ste14